MLSVETTSEAHHARLLPHVDRLLALADMVGHVDCAAIHALFEQEHAFVVGELVPHMRAIESVLYDRVEETFGGRHSMAPMREEHRILERLIAELDRYRPHVEGGCTWNAVEGMALRRVLYRLHAILRVHLAEEELYLGVLERQLDDDERAGLLRAIDAATTQRL